MPSYVPEIPYASADQATLRHALINQLRLKQGDIMWVWWGGRGATDSEGQLRLFTSDTTTGHKIGFNLDSVLRMYTSDAVRSFAKQIWMVDASEAIEGSRPSGEFFPPEAMPFGSPTHAHQQAVLYAAGRDRGHANYTASDDGSFSDILLELLADQSAVLPTPPDMNELFAAVRQRIIGVTERGRAPLQDEFGLRQRGGAHVLRPAKLLPLTPSASSLQHLVDTLLAYPQMTDPAVRETLIRMMRPEVVAMISRHSAARADLYSIVQAAQSQGVLTELFEAMQLIDDDPERGSALQEALYSPENSEENRTE
ncbi:effector-associated domain 2-containing protein [Streptomyces canus]|uniref:effector-associated domain 2-containing protein n=1 Tax=Streptomyces canus TaxID=58343 RepID=UPI002E33C60E|nr:caspase family protein [Streptomyces canus]